MGEGSGRSTKGEKEEVMKGVELSDENWTDILAIITENQSGLEQTKKCSTDGYKHRENLAGSPLALGWTEC